MPFFVFPATIDTGFLEEKNTQNTLFGGLYMSLRAFVWAILTLTILVAGAFGLLVSFLDPEVVGIYGTVLFYLLGGLLFYAISYLVIIEVYRLVLGDERAVFFLGAAARFAFWLLIAGALLLLLIRNNFWYWWSILFVFAFVLLLEVTLRAFQKKTEEDAL